MTLNITRLAQISYPVSDVERAVEFFETKLGLRLALRPHPNMAFFDAGGVSIFVEHAEDVSGASILYLACTDVAASTAELERRGVEIVSPPHRITEQPTYDLWMSFFKEPDGRLMALSMEAPKGWKPA
jgi:predicted enzyme related to lactoylglutathione lyase